jgi:hypothetical protein
MADRSNATQALNATTYTTQVNHVQQGQTQVVQNAVSSTTASGGQIPSFGTSFTYSDYGIQGAGGQVVNAVVDNTGTVLNYSTNAAPGQQIVQQRVIQGGTVVQQGRPAQAVAAPQPAQTGKGGKPMKDPNAPKKPLSAYFLFSQDERLKVKAEYPDYSITEVAKELGRRWASAGPELKGKYEALAEKDRARYGNAKREYQISLKNGTKPIIKNGDKENSVDERSPANKLPNINTYPIRDEAHTMQELMPEETADHSSENNEVDDNSSFKNTNNNDSSPNTTNDDTTVDHQPSTANATQSIENSNQESRNKKENGDAPDEEEEEDLDDESE